MSAVVLDVPRTPHGCSRCSATALVLATDTRTPMHPCPAAGGLAVALVREGLRSEVRMTEREDYVGGEDVQRDAEGRVWAGSRVVTDEGEHVAAYAPTAHANLRG